MASRLRGPLASIGLPRLRLLPAPLPLIASLCAAAALTLAGCGGNGEPSATTPPPPSARELAPVKDYLQAHLVELTEATEQLYTDARSYVAHAKRAGSDEALLDDAQLEQTRKLVRSMQKDWRQAEAAYASVEAIVAGVPSLRSHDRRINSGTASNEPGPDAGFDLTYDDGTILKNRGSHLMLTETSLWGTVPDFTVEGVEPDLNADGQITWGEAVPLPHHIAAAAKALHQAVIELAGDARRWKPSARNVYAALRETTPAIRTHFEQWAGSRRVAGAEQASVRHNANSRLASTTAMLAGTTVLFEAVQRHIRDHDGEVAGRAAGELDDLLTYVTRLRDREADGRRYTRTQAADYGAEAQRRAELVVVGVRTGADAIAR